MLRMCASISHSYTHLIQALGIVRKPTVWVFITSKYPGTHDIGPPDSIILHKHHFPRACRSEHMLAQRTRSRGQRRAKTTSTTTTMVKTVAAGPRTNVTLTRAAAKAGPRGRTLANVCMPLSRRSKRLRNYTIPQARLIIMCNVIMIRH